MNAPYRDREKQAVLDEYLVLGCREGDATALQELMSRWYSRLYGYALGQLKDRDAASDATQESLLSISRGIHRLDDPASFPRWAYQIVIRRCADWQRKEINWRARHVTDSASAIDQAPSRTAEPDTNHEAVQRAIGHLEPELGSVVRLHYFDGFSLREIGELLELPTGTIKSRLYYARKKLEHLLGGEES